jgi:16S rRNA processing protein RimM
MPDDEFIRIAAITGVHGLGGRLKILVITDIIERFKKKKSVFIKVDDRYRKFVILNYIHQNNRSGLLNLEGVSDRDAAQSLKGHDIFIKRTETEKTRNTLLEEGSYYFYDVIGCHVSLGGRPFGTVTDIMETGAGDILVVKDSAGKEYLIPFIERMVDTSEICSKKLTIHPVEGLIDI